MTAGANPGKTAAMKTRVATGGPGRVASGNRGKDKHEADKIGPGTFADDGADPAKVTRGAPPKPVKRYSLAD